MLTTNAFAGIGALVGDPARASMLVSLMDGRALTASELAACAGVTPQTASSHLGQLVTAGLVAMERQGRHRYHRLASPAIAQMVESIMGVAADAPPSRRARIRTGPRDVALRQARTCFDHLAGRVAVAMTDSMLASGFVIFAQDGGELTPSGYAFLEKLGMDLDRVVTNRSKRVFCRPCLDWSERKPHLAGAVGCGLCKTLLARNWIRSSKGSRAVDFTPEGRRQLQAIFALGDEVWHLPAV